MKKHVISLLLVLCLLLSSLPLTAMADSAKRQYIVPDSNTRYMTYEEAWEWDYESLGYIWNEIYARHSYGFKEGGSYYNYFMNRPWYDPDARRTALNEYEIANVELCKSVRKEMKAQGTTNRKGKHYLDYIEEGEIDVLSGFHYMALTTGQKLAVYAAPSTKAYRGGNGKAAVSTNGSIYVAGYENNWLLVMYETNDDAVRVGYVKGAKGVDKSIGELEFEYEEIEISEDCDVTDDPVTASTNLQSLKAGDKVTYLSSYQNSSSWAYIETENDDGQTIRGFIPTEVLNTTALNEDDESAQEE